MAYEKQTWVSGDVITAQKLNHMEDGIANSVVVISLEASSDYSSVIECSHTYTEVRELYANGTPLCLKVSAVLGPYEGMPINVTYVFGCVGQVNADGTPLNGPAFTFGTGADTHSVTFSSSGISIS